VTYFTSRDLTEKRTPNPRPSRLDGPAYYCDVPNQCYATIGQSAHGNLRLCTSSCGLKDCREGVLSVDSAICRTV